MVLLGSLMTTLLDDTHAVKDGRHASAKRTKMSSNFMHHGYNVCKRTFAFLYGLGVNHRILNIKKHYLEEGMMLRTHKLCNTLPTKTMSFDDISAIVAFLQQYSEQHGILLPGRIPGYKRDDLKLLPSSNRKRVRNLNYLESHCWISN